MSLIQSRSHGFHDALPPSGALLLSVLLHGLVLLWMHAAHVVELEPAPELVPVEVLLPKQAPPPPAVAVKPVPPPPAPAIEAPPEPAPQREAPEPPAVKIPVPQQQIVTAPEGGKNEAPDKTRFLSERDVTVEKEMVRRGEPAPGTEDGDVVAPEPKPEAAKKAAAKENASPARKPAPPRPGPRQLAALPRLDQLLPSAVELAGQGYGKTEEEIQAAAAAEAEKHRELVRRRGDAWLPTSQQIGVLDFLPDVQEGDITLLNTKAELFAPFVRRVALRVFQNLIILLRRELASGGLSTRQSISAEAVMTRHGDMSGLRITDRSASVSLGLDHKLRQACRQGFFDRNPPPGAEAKDGNIHFELRTDAMLVADAAGHPLGYQVIFQAGLL
jgi:hypothetical protein